MHVYVWAYVCAHNVHKMCALCARQQRRYSLNMAHDKRGEILLLINDMSTLQTMASNRFLTAMGPMIEDATAMNRVMSYIEWMKQPSSVPQITMCELERNGMPLHEAMNRLREKARAYYQA